MSNELSKLLVPAELLAEPGKYADNEVFARMAGSGFLPRVQLTAGLSKVVTAGKVSVGKWVMMRGKSDIMHIFGDSFSCLLLDWRPKALRIEGNTAKVYFNPRKEEFKAIERDAEKKPRVKGCLYGPEYLIYVAEVSELASLHFNNITMRNRAGDMKPLIGRAATLRVEMIENKGNSWHGPVITPCSTPLPMPERDTEDYVALMTRFKTELDKFKNPPEQVTEEVPVEEVSEQGATPGGERPR